MRFDNLEEDNINLYCMKHYDNPQCNTEVEYYEDLKKITYIKRLFNHYRLTGELKTRLILNHFIVFTNVFPVEHAVRILFFKMNSEYYSILKGFLVYLFMMPKIVKGIRGKNIISSDIFIDENVIEQLRNLK